MNSNLKRNGFTLVETLVVMAIIGILFVNLSSTYIYGIYRSEMSRVEFDFNEFHLSVNEMMIDNNGLKDIGNISDTLNEYLSNEIEFNSNNKSNCLDPWGNEYELSYDIDANKVEIRSLGKNMVNDNNSAVKDDLIIEIYYNYGALDSNSNI